MIITVFFPTNESFFLKIKNTTPATSFLTMQHRQNYKEEKDYQGWPEGTRSLLAFHIHQSRWSFLFVGAFPFGLLLITFSCLCIHIPAFNLRLSRRVLSSGFLANQNVKTTKKSTWVLIFWVSQDLFVFPRKNSPFLFLL